MSDHYARMYLAMDDAADRAVLARVREVCPQWPEQNLLDLWQFMIAKHGRAEARAMMEAFLDKGILNLDGSVKA